MTTAAKSSSRRSQEAAGGWMTRLIRPIMAVLVLIDLVLGPIAMIAPNVYMLALHPNAADDPVYFLQRAGVIWLGYLLIQAIAFFRYKRTPEWALVVAFLRLVEVPADSFLLLVGDGIGAVGVMGYIVAPLFNLVVGVYLYFWYFRYGRARSV